MSERKTKMKLSSRRNGTLVPDDDDSDSDLQEFPLPKKRIIKPGKSTYVARLDPPSALFYQDEKPVRSSTMHYIFFLGCSDSFSNVSDGAVAAAEFVLQCSSRYFS